MLKVVVIYVYFRSVLVWCLGAFSLYNVRVLANHCMLTYIHSCIIDKE